uniref:Spermatogenesis associated 1 n=1 Tax=Stegastes partitus TaxID=144197 RepID=A0A3B4ZFT2_9TELE
KYTNKSKNKALFLYCRALTLVHLSLNIYYSVSLLLQFVELHVLYVPADQWNVKLNKVPAEAIDSFISAGFIRVYPDTTLRTLRRELGALLGADGSIDRFSFLKCVGRSLALVSFTRSGCSNLLTCLQAAQPELYLLPTVEADSSVCSQSLSPDTSSSSPEQHVYYQPPKMCSLPAGTKEPVKFPHIPQRSQQSPPTPRPDEEEEDEEEEEEEEEEEDDDDEQSYSTSEDEEEALSSMRRAENRRAPQPLPLNKGKVKAAAYVSFTALLLLLRRRRPQTAFLHY